MKFKTTKKALEAAIQIVTAAVDGSDDAKINSHHLFRVGALNQVEVLSANGSRLLAGAPIKGAVMEDAVEGDAFSVPAYRVRNLLPLLKDDDEISFDSSGGITRIKTPRGLGKTGALDPKHFPFWDEQLTTAKSVGKVPVKRLAEMLSYIKPFISDQETRSPALVATECMNGVLYATDSVGVTLISSPMLKASTLRIHGNDIPSVLSFLALKGADDVELLEHDRVLFFRRDGEGSLIGVARWIHDFPVLKISKDDADKCWFSVDTASLTDSIKYLGVWAEKDDPTLRFGFDGPKLVLSVKSGSGDAEEEQQVIPFIEHDGMDALKADGYQGFALTKSYVETIAEQFGEKTLRFGVNWNKKNGYVTFRLKRGEDDYFSLVVWSKK